MWKVSFIPLVLGAACMLAVALIPRIVLAQSGDPLSDVASAAKPLSPVHRMPKHARARAAPRNTRQAPDAGLPPAPPLDPPAQGDTAAAPFPPQGFPQSPPPSPAPAPVAAPRVAPQMAAPAAAVVPPPVAAAAPVPAAASPADGQRPVQAARPQEAAAAKAKPPVPVALPREIRQFCANTASSAVDARVAWQAAKLVELEAKLKQRIAELEAKRSDYEDWLRKHDEALKSAREDVVSIYSKMRPDAAAAQLAVMDDVTAASVLSKLNARIASTILAEMDPGRAARIANAMVGPPLPGKKS